MDILRPQGTNRRHRAFQAHQVMNILHTGIDAVLGFGVIAFSSVPVLRELGETVAPGAFRALVFAALLTRRA